jgi:hypothetical protein
MLRKILILVFTIFSFQASAQGLEDNSCYQLAVEGALYPVLCLSGIYNEMGQFQMSVIGPNSLTVKGCTTHNAMLGDLVLGENSLEIYSRGGETFQIRLEAETSDFLVGQVVWPSGNQMLFFKLDESNTASHLQAVANSGLCQ